MTQLLIKDKPILLLPQLVIAVNSMERAAILQQFHWLTDSRFSTEIDGEHWIVGDMEELTKKWFPFWKPGTLRKHVNRLEADGWLISIKPNKRNWNQQKFFRVNLDKINSYQNEPEVQPETEEPDATENAIPVSSEASETIEKTADIAATLIWHDHATSRSGTIMPDHQYKKKKERGGPIFENPPANYVADPIIPQWMENQLVDALLAVTGKKQLVDAGDDRVLRWAHNDARILWNLGIKMPGNIFDIAEMWKTTDWRGKNGSPPTNANIKEYASLWLEKRAAKTKPKKTAARKIFDPITQKTHIVEVAT